jgi:hypothetical protein
MNEPSTKPLPRKGALLQRIDSAFRPVAEALETMDDAEFERRVGGGWTVEDTLAHIASWEQILLRFHLGGEPFDQVTGLPGARYRVTSFDEVNAHLHEVNRKLSADEVRTMVLQTHAELMEALADFPEERLHQPHPELSTGEAASLCWIDYIAANTYEHIEEHMAEIKSAG